MLFLIFHWVGQKICLGFSITSYLNKDCNQFNIWKILKPSVEKKVHDKYYIYHGYIYTLQLDSPFINIVPCSLSCSFFPMMYKFPLIYLSIIYHMFILVSNLKNHCKHHNILPQEDTYKTLYTCKLFLQCLTNLLKKQIKNHIWVGLYSKKK